MSNKNSRPIAAPVWAISRAASPRRSSRAIKEACSVTGTAALCPGVVETAPRAPSSPGAAAASSTAFVNFLKKKRHAICPFDDLVKEIACKRAGISGKLADQRGALRRPSRARVIIVTCGWPTQGG